MTKTSTPRTIITADHGDLEDTLERAVHMSSIAVTLAEKALDVYAHYGDAEYHAKRRKENPGPYGTYLISKQDEGTLLFSLYEAHAQIRQAWDLFTGDSDDDAPAETVAEATADQLDA